MNKAFEKILERLEELQNYACFPTEWVNEEQSKIHSYYANKLTEILKLTEQYNNGWIPCSERLPEENYAVLVWCPERKNIYCAYLEEGQWWIFGAYFEKVKLEVIAWMPLPEPFKKRD